MRGYHIQIVIHSNPPLSSSSLFPNTDTFIPTSIFQHLPAQPPKHTARRHALFNPKHKDYRYGPIRLDWIDFDNMGTVAVNGKEKEHGRGTQGQMSVIELLLTINQIPRWRRLCLTLEPNLGQRTCQKALFVSIETQFLNSGFPLQRPHHPFLFLRSQKKTQRMEVVSCWPFWPSQHG
jgi:hypothetical protein